LGLSEGLRGELRRNARLRAAATAPAERLYTGVLYEALELASLPAPAQRAARRSILISSGLWGGGAPGRPDPAVPLPDRRPPARRRRAVDVLARGNWRLRWTARPAGARCWTCAPARTRPPGRRAESWPSGR
ncbi:peroxide stress protein YaaA, partial [Micromonospora parastrephiae]|uniref:peroxide stress protein YaaA n=1 Tax=Micromonospora parastrephiae TaxID=2806101 RepID=UPI0021079BE8